MADGLFCASENPGTRLRRNLNENLYTPPLEKSTKNATAEANSTKTALVIVASRRCP